MHVWQFWNQRLPVGQSYMFQRSTDTHNYSTRSAATSITLESRNQSSIKFMVPKEWSSLPNELKTCKSMKGFRDKSKKKLIEKYRNFECCQDGCVICGVGSDENSQRGQQQRGQE